MNSRHVRRKQMLPAIFKTRSSWMFHLLALVALLISASEVSAHDGHEASGAVETTDHAIVDSPDGYHVELNMTPGFASVGQMSTLRATICHKDGKAAPAEMTLICFNLDHQTEVFRSVFTRSDGKLEMQFQFVDGADHRVSLQVKPLEKLSAAPIAVEMNVAVQAKQPPGPIVARTLAFLVGVAALALVAGFVGALKWPKAD